MLRNSNKFPFMWGVWEEQRRTRLGNKAQPCQRVKTPGAPASLPRSLLCSMHKHMCSPRTACLTAVGKGSTFVWHLRSQRQCQEPYSTTWEQGQRSNPWPRIGQASTLHGATPEVLSSIFSEWWVGVDPEIAPTLQVCGFEVQVWCHCMSWE